MKVKASSLLKKNFIGLLIWILGVAILNVVVYLIFGETNIVISLAVISIIGLSFRLLSFCHILYCILADKEIEIADGRDSTEAQNVAQSGEEVGSEDTCGNVNKTSDGNGSFLLGFCLLLVVGVILAGVGGANIKDEIRIFRKRSKIKSRGTGTLGTVTASERRIRKVGTKGRMYTYYVHTVRYDGFETTFSRPAQVPVGATVPVIYLSVSPEDALFGKPSQTVSEFKEGRFWDIFGLGFGFLIYSAMAIEGILCILLLVVRGVPIFLHIHKGLRVPSSQHFFESSAFLS